jgi:rhodanese-related sulfurtransferase
VRTPDEFKSGHIKGAKNINIGDQVKFEADVARLNKKLPVAVYCRSGRRSKIAGQRLTDKGFVVYDLNQGIIEWTNSGKAVE